MQYSGMGVVKGWIIPSFPILKFIHGINKNGPFPNSKLLLEHVLQPLNLHKLISKRIKQTVLILPVNLLNRPRLPAHPNIKFQKEYLNSYNR